MIFPSTETWEVQVRRTTGKELWTSPTRLVPASSMNSRSGEGLRWVSPFVSASLQQLSSLIHFLLPCWSSPPSDTSLLSLLFGLSLRFCCSFCSALMSRWQVAKWSTREVFVPPVCVRTHSHTHTHSRSCRNEPCDMWSTTLYREGPVVLLNRNNCIWAINRIDCVLFTESQAAVWGLSVFWRCRHYASDNVIKHQAWLHFAPLSIPTYCSSFSSFVLYLFPCIWIFVFQDGAHEHPHEQSGNQDLQRHWKD